VTTFLGREYKSCVWGASGTFGWGTEAWEGGYFPLRGLGALVTKGVSPKPMAGAPHPRIAEVGHGVGLINAIGLQNPGLRGFCEKYVPQYENTRFPCPVWVNVFADSTEGFVRVIDEIRQLVVARRAAWLAGFELNVSCPNVEKGGVEFGERADLMRELLRACNKARGAFPVMVKLSPLGSNLLETARLCEGEGASALSLCNTMPSAMRLPESNQWAIGRKFGGLSGPALRAIAVRWVGTVANELKIPVCGVGGVSSAHDVREFLSAGAQVVQVGTAQFANPWIADLIFDELNAPKSP